MKEEELQPLRETYRLYDYLKSHPEKLQVIAEVKKASPSLGRYSCRCGYRRAG